MGWVWLNVWDLQRLSSMGVVQGARWLLWMWGGGSFCVEGVRAVWTACEHACACVWLLMVVPKIR